MLRLEEKLQLITMDDIVHHRYLIESHGAIIPDFGIYTIDYDDEGNEKFHVLSRQMVIFCIERRKAWRMLQSRAGIANKDYLEQKELLEKISKEEMTIEEFFNSVAE